MSAQQPAAAAGARGGRVAGRSNWSREETLHMLRIAERILPIGSDLWDAVVSEHADDYPGRCKNAIMRKYANLYRRTIPTGDPNCPEDVKLAKRIKYLIGNKASIGDAEEDFELEDAVHVGENGANPFPPAGVPGVPPGEDPADHLEPTLANIIAAARVAAAANDAAAAASSTSPGVAASASTAVTPASGTSTARKRAYRSTAEEGIKKKEEFLEIFRMQMMTQQQNAEIERQERRAREAAQERANQQMMNMVTACFSAWASGNTQATAVFRPGQQPVIEGIEQEQQQEEEQEQQQEEEESVESPPKRLRRRSLPCSPRRSPRQSRNRKK